MRRVVGLSSDELQTRERVFDGLTTRAVRRSLRAVTASVSKLVTAAAAPTLSTTPSETSPTIPAGALGVVTATWNEQVDAQLFPFLVQTFVDAAAGVFEELALDEHKITYDAAASYLANARNRLAGIGNVVWADMRNQLVLGYGAGESIEQLAARLRQVAEISEPRALTIARTEVIPAANFGSLQQLKAAGFSDDECCKEWLATHDPRTREAHRLADGQRVGLNQPFHVDGDFLQVPGDPAGRPENVINCRCAVAYVFDDDEDEDEDEDEPLVAHGNHDQKDHGNWADGAAADASASAGSKSPFTILPKSRRGKSGDRMYAPGMWGRYGGAGVMMRHVGSDGVARYMVIQRATGGYNKWRWQLPGGARDENETAAQAAAREAFEEIGATPEILETLEPRGEHRVELPVEGKDPWSYTSVVADIPQMFKPNVDWRELGAARWLTYEQLVEMRGRNRLIAPFAAQLEDIIAKFDRPVVAGFYVTDVTTSHDYAGYYDLMTASRGKWTAVDEAKIKRDAEGKFAKKASTSVKTGKPLHINTAVIYKKGGYKPNEVIAEKAGTTATDGVAQRLIWHAGVKKFMLQGQMDNGVDWISVESYTKKAAYDKFSKETGWTKPAKAESVGSIPPLKSMSAPAQPKNIKDMSSTEFEDWFAKNFPSESKWDLAGSMIQKSVYEKAKDTWNSDPDAGDAFTQLSKWGYQPDKPAIVVKEMKEVKPTSTAEQELHEKYISGDLTDVEYQDELDKLAESKPQKTAVPAAAPAASTLGKPIHINTTAVYKTKYADGAVVAERELGDDLGTVQQLRWDAKSKKFVLLENVGNGWKTVALYNKGKTYQKFSKQTGWTHPVKKPSPPAAPTTAPTNVGTLKKSVSMMNKAELSQWIDDNADIINFMKPEDIKSNGPMEQALAKHGLKTKFYGIMSSKSTSSEVITLPDFDNMNSTLALSWILNLTPKEFSQLTPTQRTKINDVIIDLDSAGEISTSQYDKYYDLSIAAQNLKTGVVTNMIDFNKMLAEDQIAWLKDIDQTKLSGFTPDDMTKIASLAAMLNNGGVLSPQDLQKVQNALAVAGSNATGVNLAGLAMHITMMTQPEYDALSKPEKIDLYENSKLIDDPTGAIKKKMESLITTYAQTHGVTGTPDTSSGRSTKNITFDWDQTDPDTGMTPIYYGGAVIAWAKPLPGGGQATLYDVGPDGAAGSAVGHVDFDDGDTVSNAIIDLVDSGMLTEPSVSVGPGYVPNVVDDESMGDFVDSFLSKDGLAQSGIIIFMTSADVDKLTSTEYAAVAAQAAALYKDGFLTKKDFDAFNAKGTKIATPSDAKPALPVSTFAPNATKWHVDVHGKIKQVNLISTPANPPPPSHMFKVKTSVAASAMQNTMLSAAGKTWSGPETSAIKKYGTSVGYRSMNAVLRDDPKQLKLFNDAQLNDAVKHAVNLQSAMVPLTDDVQLFRGTGAHAFGQNTIAADFTKLKALEGNVITDKGFMSTTVDEKKAVSYDYASKPIQMIINAPTGTPAVYADAAIPGHGEHEIILGAGTSYRVDQVRPATAADKAKFGPGTEHVVEVTIVPSTSNNTSQINAPATPAPAVTPTTPTPGTPNAPVSATKSGPIKASDLQWPMKVNTTAVYKVKYQHGAVVAYHKNVDGSLSRLVWNANTKKFISQNQNPDGSWTAFAGYGKGEAYQLFGKGAQSTDWYAPPPGDSAIGSGGQFGTTSVAPKVSTSAPAPSTVTTAPPPAPVKQQKFDVDELQKLHGKLPMMTNTKRRELFDHFKKSTSSGFVTLSSPDASLFTALHETWKQNDDLAKVSSLIPKLNMLQLLKLIDEESTNKANAIAQNKGEPGNLTNERLYEKKLVAWLQTPSGAAYATELVYPPPPAAFDPAGPVNATKTYKSPNFTPQVIEILNKIKDPAQIGTPDPNATTFTTIGHTKALALQKQQLASDPWTTSQKNSLTKYTGNYYSDMNPVVRDIVKDVKYKSEESLLQAARTAVNIQAGMRPLPENVKVFRKTDASQFTGFGLGYGAQYADIKKLEGKLFIDRAPMSTSIDPNKWHGNVHFEIDLPKGTPAIFVDNISQNSGEMEMLLALGLKYRIISVKQKYGVTMVHMRVEA